MRIAYIAPYQGSDLVKRRPIVRNRSMSNRIKIELIAGLLRANSHQVEVISQGEVIERQFRFYPSFSESERFHPDIPVHYASALPIRRLNGFWSSNRTLQLVKDRHQAMPFDLLIVFNMKGPQLACANYAMQRLGIPVVLEYEDDAFVSVTGETANGSLAHLRHRAYDQIFKTVSGCVGVSPHLLSQLPPEIPKLLLRGVVGEDILKGCEQFRNAKKNVILFSGTHKQSNGVGQLIKAWPAVGLPGWELHITGFGEQTETLQKAAANVPGIVFHGLVSREELVRLMCSAKFCINPHELSKTPGNVFAFKLIEYLAAGAHVMTTPMGMLEKEVEEGITYMPDNEPATIAQTIKQAVQDQRWERTSAQHVGRIYGPAAVAQTLDGLLQQVVKK